jgi:hypothetical protein
VSFKSYMKKVDELCLKVTHLRINDFEDYNWLDCYEAEVDPGEALFSFFEDTGYLDRYPDTFEQYMDEGRIV